MTPRDRDRETELIDRLDAGVEPASPEEAASREPYQRLIGRIRQLGDEPPAGWKERLYARRSRERWRRRIAFGVGLAAAAIVLVLVYPRLRGGPTVGPAVAEVEIIKPDGVVTRSAAMVHDTAQLRIARSRRQTEVRVYRDNRLVARCPGGDRCRVSNERVELDVPLDEAGRYEVLVFSSDREIAGPRGDTVDGDVVAARLEGARIDPREPIIVSRSSVSP